MNSGMLQDILTPFLKINEHSFAFWDFQEECVSISWFGQKFIIPLTRKMLTLTEENDILSHLTAIACENFPISDNEVSLSPSYFFYDPVHKKECLAIMRSANSQFHLCAPGKLPSAHDLPLLKALKAEDFSTKVSGSVIGFTSDDFLPAAVLSLSNDEVENLIRPHFHSIQGLHGLLVQHSLFLGTSDSIQRYYDTDMTGSAIIISPEQIAQALKN